MPNRIIKESVCTSETLAMVSGDAERLFWRLVVQADDYGCFDARPNVIIGKCLTSFIGRVSETQVLRWLRELVEVDLVQMYSVAGRPYLHLKTWNEHQRTRATNPKYPLPSQDDGSCDLLAPIDSKRNQTPPSDNEQASELVTSIDSKRQQRLSSAALNEFENEFENVNVNDARAGAREDDDEDTWREFRRLFFEAFGGTPNSAHEEEVEGYVRDGMELKAVVEAVRIAALNNAQGWGYVRRIVQNWLKDGVRTLEQVKSRDAPAETPRLAVVRHYAPGQDPNKELVE